MSKPIILLVVTAVLMAVCDAANTISTYAGDNTINYQGVNPATYNGDGGAALSAGISAYGIAFDSSDNLYIASFSDPTVRKVTYSTGIITTFAGTVGSTYGSFPGISSDGDGGAATSAYFQLPYFVYVDKSDKYVYITDIGSSTNNIRRVDTTNNDQITLYAGVLGGTVGNNVQATSADLCYPLGMHIRKDVFYVIDQCHHSVRMIDSSGVITTYAGTTGSGPAGQGYSGDGGAATSAKLYQPSDFVFDSSGNMYIADWGNQVIRKVDGSTNIITTVAGTQGSTGYSGDNGPPASALFTYLTGMAIDCFDNLYITDTGADSVRVIDFTADTINAYAGVSGTGGYAGDSGDATSASLDYPFEIAIDSSNNVYISDSYNYVVRKVIGNPSAAGCPVTDDDDASSGSGSDDDNGSSSSSSSSASDSSDDNSLYGLFALIAILPISCIIYFIFGARRNSKEKKEPVPQNELELPPQTGTEVADASYTTNSV